MTFSAISFTIHYYSFTKKGEGIDRCGLSVRISGHRVTDSPYRREPPFAFRRHSAFSPLGFPPLAGRYGVPSEILSMSIPVLHLCHFVVSGQSPQNIPPVPTYISPFLGCQVIRVYSPLPPHLRQRFPWTFPVPLQEKHSPLTSLYRQPKMFLPCLTRVPLLLCEKSDRTAHPTRISAIILLYSLLIDLATD